MGLEANCLHQDAGFRKVILDDLAELIRSQLALLHREFRVKFLSLLSVKDRVCICSDLVDDGAR